jgi:hypothetical protein
MISAMIRYGQDHGRRMHQMSPADLKYAREHIDEEMMHLFHYTFP